MRISDWSSDVCSSDLKLWLPIAVPIPAAAARRRTIAKALAWGRGVSLSRLVLRATVRNSGPLRSSRSSHPSISAVRQSPPLWCPGTSWRFTTFPSQLHHTPPLCQHTTSPSHHTPPPPHPH